MMTDEQIQQIAREWAEGIDLTVCGVDLRDVIAYDVMRIVGLIAVKEKMGKKEDPHE